MRVVPATPLVLALCLPRRSRRDKPGDDITSKAIQREFVLITGRRATSRRVTGRRATSRRATALGADALNPHHAKVLMSEDVAVEDEIADVHSAEVHKHLDLWVRNDWIAVSVNASWWGVAIVRRRRTVAERNLDHVKELAVDGRCLHAAVGFEVVLLEHLEMDLVLMEFVVFLSAVLDDPLLHGSLGGDD